MTFPVGLVYSIITLLILLIIFLRLGLKKFESKAQWLYFLFGSAIAFTFIFLAGGWPYMSFYLRWVFLLIWLLLVGLSLKRVWAMPFNADKFRLGFYFWRTVGMALFGFLLFMWLQGFSYDKSEVVELDFPLKKGKYYVMQGGGSRLTNPFHTSFNYDLFGYALDIAGLSKLENRSHKLFPKELDDFIIYGDTVFAPCNGRVIEVTDTVSDNIPADLNVTQVHGNHVVIQCEGVRVFMAHLLKDNVFVKLGDEVSTGQPIAVLGNSGFTAEPHLHISALVEYNKDTALSGRSVPILFNGKFYSLNEVIR